MNCLTKESALLEDEKASSWFNSRQQSLNTELQRNVALREKFLTKSVLSSCKPVIFVASFLKRLMCILPLGDTLYSGGYERNISQKKIRIPFPQGLLSTGRLFEIYIQKGNRKVF